MANFCSGKPGRGSGVGVHRHPLIAGGRRSRGLSASWLNGIHRPAVTVALLYFRARSKA